MRPMTYTCPGFTACGVASGIKKDGGWPLCDDLIDSKSIVYSFGVGTNVWWEPGSWH